MNRKNMRRISTLVTAQTAYNAEKLRVICGYKSIGQVFDKLVREKMLSLHTDLDGLKKRGGSDDGNV